MNPVWIIVGQIASMGLVFAWIKVADMKDWWPFKKPDGS